MLQSGYTTCWTRGHSHVPIDEGFAHQNQAKSCGILEYVFGLCATYLWAHIATLCVLNNVMKCLNV